MKRILSLLLILTLVFALVACSNEKDTSSDMDTSTTTQTETESSDQTDTTPSNTTPSNNTPSNSTPNKTEEPKPTVVAGEYTVIFDYGYDNKKITAKSKNYKVAKPGNPTREGYDFCGWYAENEEACWNFAGHVVTEDMTLTARWQERMVSNASQETQSQETQSQKTTSQETTSEENQSQDSSSIPS